LHSYRLADDEVHTVRGMRVTTAARTAFDIGCGLPVAKAVPILDALLNATGVKLADVITLADRHSRGRGIRRLRAALELVDGGAESPQETRVRLLLVGAGLPTPETQIEFRDLRIRVDMGWREWEVAGWSVVRVSAEMLSCAECDC
jgi:hypothetical protein